MTTATAWKKKDANYNHDRVELAPTQQTYLSIITTTKDGLGPVMVSGALWEPEI